ncbi:MAG: metallophosphoesterase family protein [Gemmataceae bacterium]
MNDAIILSDLHLGSENCRARELWQFLERIRDGKLATRRIILNGDVFDSIDFRRLKKNHWKVLSTIRKLSDEVETIWVHGNHDGEFELISHLLGVSVVDRYVFKSGGKLCLCLHGHQFDEFIRRYRVTTWLADQGYRFLQKLDSTHTFARFAKRKSKVFLRNLEAIESGALMAAQESAVEIVCCGHTHVATSRTVGGIQYGNSGCWTETPSHYLTVDGGRVFLHTHDAMAETVRDEFLTDAFDQRPWGGVLALR